MTLPWVSALHPRTNFILGIGQPLGSIAAGLPQNRGRPAWRLLPVICTPRATFTCLCDREKFGMVEVRTAALSQFWAAHPAQGLQRLG
jgi:hypothetical protein